MTSSNAGRLLVVYRYGTTSVVRRLLSATPPAGRQRQGWSGRTASGQYLHGRYAYTIEAIDTAGNRSISRRHPLRIL